MKSRQRNNRPYNATRDGEGHDGKPACGLRKQKRGDRAKQLGHSVARASRAAISPNPRVRPVGTGAGTSCEPMRGTK